MNNGLRRGFDKSAVGGGVVLDVAATSVGNATITAGYSGITSPTPTLATGVAQQLSTDRELVVYIEITTGATAFALAYGPTSACATTLFTGTTAVCMYTVILPRGWWIKITSASGVWVTNVQGH